MTEEVKACCPIGSERQLSIDYKPMGEIVQIDGVSTYEVGKGSKAIVVISDIFGYASGRHRLIADQLAHEGYRVVMPALLPHETGVEGDGYDNDADLSKEETMNKLFAFIGTVPWEGGEKPERAVKTKLGKIFKKLKDDNTESVGMIGFCWGCWVNWHASADFDQVNCAVNCHPSTRVEGPGELALAKSVKCPQLLQPAGNDPENLKPGGEMLEALKALPDIGDKMKVEVFPDMAHGWVTRGDVVKDDNTQRDVTKAMKNAVEFFAAHL